MAEQMWKKVTQHLGVESAKAMTKAGFELGEILTSAGGITIAEYALGKMVERVTGRQPVKLRTNLGVVTASARVRKVRGVPSVDMRSLRDIKVVNPSPLYRQLYSEAKVKELMAKREAHARQDQAKRLREFQQRLRRLHRL